MYTHIYIYIHTYMSGAALGPTFVQLCRQRCATMGGATCVQLWWPSSAAMGGRKVRNFRSAPKPLS